MPKKSDSIGVAEAAGAFETRRSGPAQTWKLEDAKARFSEVVRRAHAEGPQRVTVRGKESVVVISAEDFARMAPPALERPPFLAFMESLALDGLDLTRARDTGRDVSL